MVRTPALALIFALATLLLSGCKNLAPRQSDEDLTADYWRRTFAQMDEYDRQLRRGQEDFDRQVKLSRMNQSKLEDQAKRIDAILEKQEEQAKRYDAILKAMERQHQLNQKR